MGRHSKNNTASSFHTYHEKKAAGYGTQRQRLGKGAHIPFGYCALSLALAVDPVATPSGDIYCRECIYKYLLDQNKKLKRQRARYQEQLAELERGDVMAQRAAADAKLKEFVEANTSAATADTFRAKSVVETADERKSHERVKEAVAKKADAEALASMQREFIPRSEVNTKEVLQRTSFWRPEHQPSSEAAKIPKPDKAPRDPMHPALFLRLKQLVKVNFRATPGKKTNAGAGEGTFMCAVTRKPITHQKAVLLKPSGEVVLASCLKDVVLPSMRCPITNKKLRKRDIIKLTPGGTGFSAHNTVEASKYTPTMG